MDPYFLADYSDGNFGVVMPISVWVAAVFLTMGLCLRWGRKTAIKNYPNYFHKKYFESKYFVGRDNFEGRERNALKTKGQGYMVIEQIPDANKGTSERQAPISLWKINDTHSGGHIVATPIAGYEPAKGDMVHLMSWTTERFNASTPTFMYFIEPAHQARART